MYRRLIELITGSTFEYFSCIYLEGHYSTSFKVNLDECRQNECCLLFA